MKNLIVYSSLTGNTKKIAEACHGVCGIDWDLKSIEEYINLNEYDKVVVGFWVDRGQPDKKSLELISKLENKKIAFFATLGAYSDSEHAQNTLDNAKKLFEKNNNIVFSQFICQGAVDPKLIERMKTFPLDHPHGPNPARLKRWEDASKHPNEADLENAENWFKPILNWS